MHPIDKVHNKVVSGYVLNSNGEWISRSLALKNKKQLMNNVLSGNVENNGQWVPLKNARLLQTKGRGAFLVSVKAGVDKVNSIERQIFSSNGCERNMNSIEKVQSDNFNFVFKKTVQLNTETVLTISEIEIQLNRVNIFAVDGYLDQSNCKKIQEEFTARMVADVRFIVFDFSKANLITSAGWGILAALKGQLHKMQGDLLVSSMTGEIEESFRLLQFGSVLKSFPSNAECLVHIKKVICKDAMDTATLYIQNDKLVSESGKILPSDMPLQEKIKTILAQYGPVSIGEIGMILKEKEFGREKIGFFKLYMSLREMNLDTKEKRMRFYRSC